MGDGISDAITVNLTNAEGPNQTWVVVDASGNIIIMSDETTFDFENRSTGILNIFNVSFDDVTGLELGLNINNVFGCFDFSNSIVVNLLSGNGCVGEVVINEILANNTIELKNIGFGAVDISDFFLFNRGDNDQLGNLIIICGDDFILNPGELLTLQLSDITLNTNSDEIALYISSNIANSNDMIDYVQWGSSSHGLTNIALFSNNWSSGDFIPSWDSESISFDGSGNNSTDWFESDASSCIENTLTGDDSDHLEFKVSPNPSSDKVMLYQMNQNIKEAVLILFDVYGRALFKQNISMNIGEQYQLNLSEYLDGNYYLLITDGKISKSVIISKVTK